MLEKAGGERYIHLWTAFNTSAREEINLKSPTEHHGVDHDLTLGKATKR